MKLTLKICSLFLPLLVTAKGSSSDDKGAKLLAIGIPQATVTATSSSRKGKGKPSGSARGTPSCAYDSPIAGCVEVMNGQVASGNRLILGDCSDPDSGFSGENKSPERIYSNADSSLCMDVDGDISNNAKLTLMPCNKNKSSQYFSWDGSRLHPVADTTLCVTYRGFTADVGEDLIILKPCATVEKQQGKGAPKDWCYM